MEKLIDLLNEVTTYHAVSGNEKHLSDFLHQKFLTLADDVIYDNLGSIYAVKKSEHEDPLKVMITGFLDEPGFIIKDIKQDGKILVLFLGLSELCISPGTKVAINKLDKDNSMYLYGCISDKKTNKKNEYFIDFGFKSAQEAWDYSLNYGDMVCFDIEPFVSYNKEIYFAKALRRSYGLVHILYLLESLQHTKLPFDLYLGATVLNEVGNRGAQTATHRVSPDLAITLDVSPLTSNINSIDEQLNITLGAGPLVTYYDKSILPNRALISYMKQVATTESIVLQPYFSMSSSDAGWIHKLSVGTPTMLLNILGANMNSPSNMISLKDLYDSIMLSKKMLELLKPKDINGFKKENR